MGGVGGSDRLEIVMVLGLLVGVAGVWVAGHGIRPRPETCATLGPRTKSLDRAQKSRGSRRKSRPSFAGSPIRPLNRDVF